ncbi:hypothetical protein LZ32DRAFT_615416 [Colletotrichum eremochloae]|nr:hypothetical protein LZ32DRAFT_615416 [Colletotrichum eremochloae]
MLTYPSLSCTTCPFAPSMPLGSGVPVLRHLRLDLLPRWLSALWSLVSALNAKYSCTEALGSRGSSMSRAIQDVCIAQGFPWAMATCRYSSPPIRTQPRVFGIGALEAGVYSGGVGVRAFLRRARQARRVPVVEALARRPLMVTRPRRDGRVEPFQIDSGSEYSQKLRGGHVCGQPRGNVGLLPYYVARRVEFIDAERRLLTNFEMFGDVLGFSGAGREDIPAPGDLFHLAAVPATAFGTFHAARRLHKGFFHSGN